MKIDILKWLWIGFGLLFLSLILSIFIISQNLGSIEREENAEAIGVAAYEMEINVVGSGLGVLKYLVSGDQEHRMRVENDVGDFRQFHARYKELAVSDQDKELAKQIGEAFEEYKTVGNRLMDTKDKQRALLQQVGESTERIDEIIDEKIQQPIDRSGQEGAEKAREAIGIEADAYEVSTWLGTYLQTHNPAYRDRIFENAKDLREHIARFKELRLTAENRQRIDELEKVFEQVMTNITAILELHDGLEDDEKRFIGLRTDLDQILDDRIQAANEQVLGTAQREAENSVWYLRIFSRVMLILGLAITVISTLLIVRRSTQLKTSNTELELRIVEREEAEKQLRTSREQLRALTAHLQSVREEERTRISREIHDDLGQLLAAMVIDLSWIEQNLSSTNGTVPSDKLLKRVRSVMDLTETTMETVRRVATELRAGLLDDFGLAAAIERQTQEFEERTGVRCDLVVNLDGAEIEPAFASAAFHIFREAMTNIARHAQATNVSIVIEENDGALVLQVEDDGIGVTEEDLLRSSSLGVVGMRERALILDGELEVRRVGGKGTRVTARIPLNNRPAVSVGA